MDELPELRRRIRVVLAYLIERQELDGKVNLELIRQILTRPRDGVGKRLS